MLRLVLAFLLSVTIGSAALAQSTDREATGGAQTLEDIMARQQGQSIDDAFRRNATGDADTAAASSAQLGTLGGASDPEVWRALRYGSADITVSSGGEVASVLIQDGGMRWLEWRKGALRQYGGWLLLGTIALLAVFFVLRGRIKIDEPMTGRTVTRFQAIERFGHWLLAGSFIILGLTGLAVLFGRVFIAPMMGKEFNATLLSFSKLVHNNVAWAFIVGLVMIFVMWVVHNIPNRTDLTWLRQAGGIIGKAHPPAKKFNAGQKLIFWSVILFGVSISLSGVALLFPFELQLFAKTFSVLNSTGLPELLGFGVLPEQLSPHEEMQYSQLWHAIAAFILMAIILAHIYIGSIGMEGAFDAMGSGEVDEAWAHQHHSIWLEEIKEKADKVEGSEATPAE
ncbi:formate dehydrogenase subunit gamma [Aliiroseovarius marinus]|uniref:formate dehydrogenase subunit gamma n=1 Tax=Aliiroseovarius marinus TaxID=2500159 RepID=UPI00105D9C2A|nr:formate dehydrogenase subunit gamma [Aliiroseovarius marinus]